jgi:hypothetical protein
MTLKRAWDDEQYLLEVLVAEAWIDDVEEEEDCFSGYNLEFDRLYKKARAEQAGPAHSVPSLVDLCSPIVGQHLTNEAVAIMPEELVSKVQRHTPKDLQIAVFKCYREWFTIEEEEADAPGSLTLSNSAPAARVKYECPYNERGQKHGLCRRWHTPSQLAEEKLYEFGLKMGDRVQYHFNGRKAMEAPYHRGKLEGTVRWWFESGQLNGEQNYYDDKRNGRGLLYREDGSLWKSFHFRDGLKHGFCKTYAPDGSLVKNASYQNGKKKRLIDSLTTSWPCMPKTELGVAAVAYVVT